MVIATVCGALAAHGLKERLTPAMLTAFETAVRYQFYQSLGLLAIGVLGANPAAEALDARLQSRLSMAAWLLLAGIVLFCGSLYALALGAPHVLGAVTPLGGASLILGWIAFVLAFRSAGR